MDLVGIMQVLIRLKTKLT